MQLPTLIKKSSKKFTRGFIAIFLIKCSLFSLFILIQSCDVNGVNDEQNRVKDEFRMSLDASIDGLNYLEIKEVSSFSGSEDSRLASKSANDIIYIELPSNIHQNIFFDEINFIRMSDIVNVINSYDASVTYSKSGSGISLQVPTEKLVEKLEPSLQAAKNYLYSRGFSQQELTNMINEENGQEIDLIPFVMALVTIEDDSRTAIGFSELFFNSAYAGDVTWKDYARCAMVAIGADVLWSLGGSSAKTWSKSAMRKAFKIVAKRFLGPIGVAISVVTFGVCIGEAYLK